MGFQSYLPGASQLGDMGCWGGVRRCSQVRRLIAERQQKVHTASHHVIHGYFSDTGALMNDNDPTADLDEWSGDPRDSQKRRRAEYEAIEKFVHRVSCSTCER